MNNTVLFTEKQRFNQWWILLILIAVNLVIISSLMVQWRGTVIWDLQPIRIGTVAIGCLLSILISAFIYSNCLETVVKIDGIYVRFSPFQYTFKHIVWSELKKYYLRTYNPFAEFGGWGYRFGIFGKGTALNIAGNKGQQLEFVNGKKLLIGTQKPEEMLAAIKQCMSIELV